MAENGLLGSTKDSVWVGLMENGDGKVTLTSGGSKKVKVPEISGEVVQVTYRPFVPFKKTEPEVFKSGAVRREILVNLDVDGVEHVLPIKESSDLHKKLKSAAKKAQVSELEDLVGRQFTAKIIGRDTSGEYEKKIHDVTLG